METHDKEKILKAAQEKRHITYRENRVRMTTDFPLETKQEDKHLKVRKKTLNNL